MAEINNNPAVIWGTRRISWSQLDQYCVTVIGHLKGLGIRPGERVAICAPTSTEYIIVLFAAWRMKVIVAPVNHKWPAKTITDYLSRINASLLLTTHAIKSQIPHLVTRTLFLNEVVGFDARKDARVVGESFNPDPSQEVTIIATSGSSGEAKPVLHTWGNHLFNAKGSQDIIPIKSSDRWALSLPLFHVSGMAIVVRTFLNGAAMAIPTEEALEETILKRQVTHISLVSTQLFRLFQTQEGIDALKSLKFILLGGSVIPAGLLEQAKALGLNVFMSYGLTETASQVATGKVGGCVKVLPYRELKISDEGEVLIKGPVLFKGYIQAGRIQLPLTEDGYFKTGDLGQLDKDGCLKVLGRKDNMFISGGENIQPEEIEAVLLKLKGVERVIVTSKEDAEFGRRPVAFIKFIDDEDIAHDQIIQHCKQHLTSFKIPVAFHPWPQNLMEKGLKVSRKEFSSFLRPYGA